MKNILIIFLLLSNLVFSKIESIKTNSVNVRMLPVSVAVNKYEESFLIDSFTNSILFYNEKRKHKLTVKIPNAKTLIDIFAYGDFIFVLSADRKISILDRDGNIKYQYIFPIGKLLGELLKPDSIYVNDKYIYISDLENRKINLFDLKGNIVDNFGFHSLTEDGFLENTGLAVSDSNIFVADRGTKEIKVFNMEGFYLKTLVDEKGNAYSFKSLEDIFFDKYTDELYVVDEGAQVVSIYNRDLKLRVKIGSKGTGKVEFSGVRDIWVSKKYIYVADTTNNRVKIFDKNNLSYVGNLGPSNTFNYLVIIIVIIILYIAGHTTHRIIKKVKNKS